MIVADLQQVASDCLPAVSSRNKALRLGYVLRYHRPSQLAHRLLSLARKRLIRVTAGRYARVPTMEVEPKSAAGLGRMAERKTEERRHQQRNASHSALLENSAESLLAGRYRFLGVERELPDPIDWRLATWPDAPHLWRFHLHYHEFLLDLVAEGLGAGRPECVERAWNVVMQWIEANPLDGRASLSDAWHPFCISRRLPVWFAAWSVAPPEASQHKEVLTSVFQQARFLEDHLERDLGGNHLLENARGLVLAGCFLKGLDAERWRHKGAEIIQAELPEQILPHGEHFERSPGYHAEMLEAMLDVRDAAADVMPDLAELCGSTAERMARFLAAILHPDGDVPLWGDCWLARREVISHRLKVAPEAGKLCVSSASAADALGDTWIYRDGGDCLLFDAGPVGPDHLPAHAHADLLSFEASLDGRRVFVDSGVSGYEDDSLRRYCRSTAAHNVLEVDGAEQCDLWSRFRMGYRGRPFGFHWGRSGSFDWAAAGHNAYRRIGVPAVARWIACRRDGPWVCIDRAQGRGSHRLTLRLHVHPDVVVEQLADDEIRLKVGTRRCRLRYLTPGRVAIAAGWYCEGFGRSRPAPVLVWEASSHLPAVCGWSLSWTDSCPAPALDSSRPGKLALYWSSEIIPVDLPSGGC